MTDDRSSAEETGIDTSVPHSARIWNYWLGGTDNYPVDREAGEAYREIFPGITDVARSTRAFLARAVRYLADEAGMRQFLDADIRNPAAILSTAANLLDFTRPVALMLMGIMGHFTDDEAYPIVARLLVGLPSGSYFALYDGADTNEAFSAAQQGYNDSGAVPYYLRSPERFERFFETLDLVEPGVSPVQQWRPETGSSGPAEVYSYCGVARKP